MRWSPELKVDELTVRRVERILEGYIEAKVPREVRSSVRLTYEWKAEGLTLMEERPDAQGRRWHGIAVARFVPEQGRWRVYARNPVQGWERVPSILPSADFECQLEQVELDMDGLFWPVLDADEAELM
ncbi:DUF3024 domain-containing protein [Paenibacillus sanguinis]|uniref:DUF3024 domain-containing protein n=1 Tax=Paenibacillus sanguinis TaxID=225906 RepID=UPI00036692BF|nr:DUF3024 domain-containing protein [Paenibacillus sanguinis]